MVPDVLGSVRGAFDADLTMQAIRDYAPYCDPFGEQGSFTGPFSFTGEPVDANGLTHLRARYYAPSIGRFFQLDPSWQDQNLYAYGRDNPLRYSDPSGLSSCGDPEEALVVICKVLNPLLNIGVLILDTLGLGMSASGVILELVGLGLGEAFSPFPGDEVVGFVAAIGLYWGAFNRIENLISLQSFTLAAMNEIVCTRDTHIERVENIYPFGVSATELVLGPDTSTALTGLAIGNSRLGRLQAEAMIDTLVNLAIVYYDLQRMRGQEPFWGLRQFRIGRTETGRYYIRVTRMATE
jgi:RHS repeat-associated protein